MAEPEQAPEQQKATAQGKQVIGKTKRLFEGMLPTSLARRTASIFKYAHGPLNFNKH